MTNLLLLSLQLLSRPAAAEDCSGQPLTLRQQVPGNGSTAVPIDTRILLSFIGLGDGSHISLGVTKLPGGVTVEGTTSSSCYAHESSTEVHCSFYFHPDEDFEPATDYRINATATSSHPSPGTRFDSNFTTGLYPGASFPDAPDLSFLYYGPRYGTGVDECDWQDAYQYDLLAVVEADLQGLSVLEVYEVDGDASSHVHTLFLSQEQGDADFRQVLEPGTEGERCYEVYRHNAAGAASEGSGVVCWEEPVDTAPPADSGEPAADSGESPEEEEDPADSADPEEPGSPPPGGGGSAVTVEQSGGGCGCSGAPGGGGGLLFLVLLAGRRRRG